LVRSYEREYRNAKAQKMVEEYKKIIVECSVKYNIASKYTSFISVNERDEKVFEPTDFENVRLSEAELKAGMCAMAVPMKSKRMMSCGGAKPFMYSASRVQTGMFFFVANRKNGKKSDKKDCLVLMLLMENSRKMQQERTSPFAHM